MSRRKSSIPAGRLDTVRELLQESSKLSRALAEIKPDKRSRAASQRLINELRQEFKPAEIAAEIGISHQRWTSLRKQVEAGKVSAPEIRALLSEAQEKLRETPYRLQDGALFAPSLDWTKGKVRAANVVKSVDTLKQAQTWRNDIAAGAEYFIIARGASEETGRLLYHVVDIRNENERTALKGTLDGQTRAMEILRDYTRRGSGDEEEDEE